MGLVVAAYRQDIPDTVRPSSVLSQTATVLPVKKQATEKRFTTEEFQYVWNKPLQRPIVDPPPPPVPEAVVQPARQRVVRPKLNVELLGTLVDDDEGQARAWIMHKSKPLMIGIGDLLPGVAGEAMVAKIEDNAIVVQRDEELESFELNAPILFTESEPSDRTAKAGADD